MIYVTSDLHGYPVDKFKSMLSSVGFCDDDFLYVLGDVIDRGDDGIKILRLLMSMPNAQLILGNHEAMLLSCDFLFEEITDESIANLNGSKLDIYSTWVANGGQPTVSALKTMRKSEVKYLLEYLSDAPLYDVLTVGERDFILTHSGLGSFDEKKKLSQYSKTDLLWNRPSLNQRYFDDITVIFGHTPTLYYGNEYQGRAIVTDTWIDIDTGAARGLPPMLLRLDDMKEIYFDEEN
ncbi:MAG: metallophosphoesterase [Clostridia bacterium]|nr:metallophosphoesterase [Clostridia bacterium]